MLLIEVNVTPLLRPNERLALRGGAAGRVRNSQKCEDRSKNNCCSSCALGFPNGVLARISLVVSNGGHNQVSAVDGDHASLDESGSRVVLLNERVDAHDRDDYA